MTDPMDKELDDFFAAARGAPEPSEDLMARVLADAAALQPEARGFAPVDVPQPGLWASVMEMIGGWPALSGVAAAGVAGLWLGVAPPASIEDFAAGVLGTGTAVNFVGEDFAAWDEVTDG